MSTDVADFKPGQVYARIRCKDVETRDAIIRAMDINELRGAVIVIGHLEPFPPAERRRMLAYLWDRYVANPGPKEETPCPPTSP